MSGLTAAQKIFFSSQQTKDINFRIAQLKILEKAILEYESSLTKALFQDLGRSEMDSYTSEIGFCLKEISHQLKNLKKWCQPKRVHTNRLMFPLGKSFILQEPLGRVLIIGPWNYPFALIISPLIGALAAGNCVTLKPSEIAPQTAQVLQAMIEKFFPKEYLQVIQGGPEQTQALLKQKFDYIFFTGSPRVGQIVMEAAAKNLTPLTLELGGKSPCIVAQDCDLEKAADRIVYGKFLNAGQTCVAPDYLLVQADIKTELIKKLKATIHKFYGPRIEQSPDYSRIINAKHFTRLVSYLQDVQIIYGGQKDPQKLFLAPTLVDKCENSKIMQEEIFGPILPLIQYTNEAEVIDFVNQRPKSLALYLFSNNKKLQKNILAQTSTGGVCLNDVLFHIANLELPFGGVGESGFGRYHGQASFETFSNTKSVFQNTVLFETPRFPPGSKSFLKMLRRCYMCF